MKKNELHIAYQSYSDLAELSQADRELIDLAVNATKNAYAPYSEFHVGTALQLKNGQIITGSNQENSAYPSGLCAERVALFHAGSQYPGEIIETMVITARTPGHTLLQVVKPCGACRQVMLESVMRQKTDFRIILAGENGQGLVFDSIKDLLPFSFSFE